MQSYEDQWYECNLGHSLDPNQRCWDDYENEMENRYERILSHIEACYKNVRNSRKLVEREGCTRYDDEKYGILESISLETVVLFKVQNFYRKVYGVPKTFWDSKQGREAIIDRVYLCVDIRDLRRPRGEEA